MVRNGLVELVRVFDGDSMIVVGAYERGRELFSQRYGSCLDATDYQKHRENRESYAVGYAKATLYLGNKGN